MSSINLPIECDKATWLFKLVNYANMQQKRGLNLGGSVDKTRNWGYNIN